MGGRESRRGACGWTCRATRSWCYRARRCCSPASPAAAETAPPRCLPSQARSPAVRRVSARLTALCVCVCVCVCRAADVPFYVRLQKLGVSPSSATSHLPRPLSSNTRASTDDAGAGVPFGCIVTSDNWISTGSSSSESSSPSSFRSALRSVRSVWLTLHAVSRRFAPDQLSHSGKLCFV